MTAERPAVWLAFARASLAIGLTAGFGLGTLLFASLALNGSPGLWWPAAAQAHGHAQLYGWAGMMVLGVGLHFLPRLASAPEISAAPVRRAFWLFLAGLSGRVIAQPAQEMVEGDAARWAFGSVWALGAVGELLGAAILAVALGRAFRAALPLRPNAPIRQVMPFLFTAFTGLLLALAGAVLATLAAAFDGHSLLPHRTSTDLALVTFYAFLVPISVAMSARLFPLYLRTRSTRPRLLQAGLLLLVAGLGMRLLGDQWGPAEMERVGRLLLMLAAFAFAIGLGVFERRRQLPRQHIRLWRDAPGLHAVTAYAWLVVAAISQFPSGERLDAELHLLGAGFVSLLILGMGAHLLPGFARRPMRGAGYVWLTLALGNLAVALRTVPAIPGLSLPATTDRSLGAAAGIAGLLALVCFAINLSDALAGSRALQRPQAHRAA